MPNVCRLHYDYCRLDGLHKMLKKLDDWIKLGSADGQKSAKEGTVEAWVRLEKNPGCYLYGLKTNAF